MKYVEIFVKSALSPSNLEDVDFSLNPYVGCEHRCVYCYSPYTLHANPEEWRRKVYVKVNLPTLLDREMKKVGRARILIGSVTDAYQPAEGKYGITSKCLDVLLRRGAKITILTKSALILRDREKIEKFEDAEVGVTITTMNEEFRRIIEPYADSIENRFRVLRKFSNDMKRYVFIGPLFENADSDIEKIFEEASNIGVDYIMVDRFRFRRGMKLPPGLKFSERYYREVKRKIEKIGKEYGLPTFILF